MVNRFTQIKQFCKKNGLDEKEVTRELSKFDDSYCNICGILQESYTRRLSIEHCHHCLKMRGYTCGPCNTQLEYIATEMVTTTYLYKHSDRYIDSMFAYILNRCDCYTYIEPLNEEYIVANRRV